MVELLISKDKTSYYCLIICDMYKLPSLIREVTPTQKTQTPLLANRSTGEIIGIAGKGYLRRRYLVPKEELGDRKQPSPPPQRENAKNVILPFSNEGCSTKP